MDDGWRLASILEHPLRRIIQIVELTLFDRPQKQDGEQPAERERHGQEEEDGSHLVPRSARATVASTRAAPQMTMPLESGISTAATSGLIQPAMAAPTASTL